MFILPESPRYLIRKGRPEKAEVALARLLSCSRDDRLVQMELEDISTNLRMEREMEMAATGGKGNSFIAGYKACFKRENSIMFRTLTGIFLQAWQQLTGIKYVLYFTSCVRAICLTMLPLQLYLLLRHHFLQELWCLQPILDLCGHQCSECRYDHSRYPRYRQGRSP